MNEKQTTKARQHAMHAELAATRLVHALGTGKPITLEDCKVLEAAGCWLRRNAVDKPA